MQFKSILTHSCFDTQWWLISHFIEPLQGSRDCQRLSPHNHPLPIMPSYYLQNYHPHSAVHLMKILNKISPSNNKRDKKKVAFHSGIIIFLILASTKIKIHQVQRQPNGTEPPAGDPIFCAQRSGNI